MEIRCRMFTIAYIILLFSFHIVRSEDELIIIQPRSYKSLTANISIRDLGSAFDNDRETQAQLLSEGQEVSFLISLPVECQIDVIEIISDVPSQLQQTVHVGFALDLQEPMASLAYECKPQETRTVCQPACNGEGKSQGGVVGRTLIWTLKRTGQPGWTRIYDVIISGRSYEERIVVQDKVADITLRKPYRIEHSDTNRCTDPLWKLCDDSVATSSLAPVSTEDRQMTVYFGQSHSITKVGVIVSKSDTAAQPVSELVLEFGGSQPVSKRLRLGSSDCELKNEAIGLYICLTGDIVGIPYTNVTVNAKGLVRLHVFGMPIYFPRIGLMYFPKSPESIEENLELKCVSMECGANLITTLEALVRKQPASMCTRYGLIVNCKHMELLRLVPQPPTTTMEDSPASLATLIVGPDGALQPDAQRVMAGLHVVNASSEQLVVSIPRNIVFQRNYSAVMADVTYEPHLGFFELPGGELAGYFNLLVSGHSLTDKVEVEVEYYESDQIAKVTSKYAEKTSVLAFPRAAGAELAWPIPAYKIDIQEAWPDTADGKSVTIKWKAGDEASAARRSIKDELRIIVPEESRSGTVRAWVWQRDAKQLDIRVYYQIGQTQPDEPVEIYLQQSTCDANSVPERIHTLKLSDQCPSLEDLASGVTCVRTAGGMAVQFKVTDTSASDSYTVYRVSTEADKPDDQQLAHSSGMVQDLKPELERTERTLKIVELAEGSNPEETLMTMSVEVLSKVIVDNSACRPVNLIIHPTWPVTEPINARLTKKETRFTLPVPNDQRMMTLDVELRIGASSEPATEGAETPAADLVSRRSSTLPNPRYYELNITTVNDTDGQIKWSQIPTQFRDLLDRFDVKLSSTSRVCGISEDLRAPTVHATADGYSIRLADLPEFKSSVFVDYDVQITPVFRSSGVTPIHGATTQYKMSVGKLGATQLQIPEEGQHQRQTRVFVIPSQPAPCLRGNQPITVKWHVYVVGEDSRNPEYLTSKLQTEADPVEEGASDHGRWYTISGLMPGRRYEVMATVHYPAGMQDVDSVMREFSTPDDVTISTHERYVSPGESVSVNCTGVVGSTGTSQKQLEWKRSDGSPLPEGGETEIIRAADAENDWSQTIRLHFAQVEPGQAATYACFIKPSVAELAHKSVVRPEMKLVISELELSQRSFEANQGEAITVLCTSQGEGDLVWHGPEDQVIGAANVEQASVYAAQPLNPAPGAGKTLELHIPNTRLSETGNYTCSQSGSETKRLFELRMREDVQLSFDEKSSLKAGENVRLKCATRLGVSRQQVAWYKRPTGLSQPSAWIKIEATDPAVTISEETPEEANGNSRLSKLEVINSPASSGQFACGLIITEMEQSDKMLPRVNVTLRAVSEPVVKIDAVQRGEGDEQVVRCRGYPSHDTDRLNWYYLPAEQTEENAIPVFEKDSGAGGANRELRDLIRTSFRIGDSTPATWPGSGSPILLAASGRISARNSETVPVTQERLELLIKSSPEALEGLGGGKLLCRYQRPKAVILMNEGVPMLQPVDTSSDNAEIMAAELIDMSSVFNPQSKPAIPDNGHSSNLDDDTGKKPSAAGAASATESKSGTSSGNGSPVAWLSAILSLLLMKMCLLHC